MAAVQNPQTRLRPGGIAPCHGSRALDHGLYHVTGGTAAQRGSRCQTLPIETVSRMQSGDFGVSMSEIQPNGYITPGSFTNDGRYRVSELAVDIRRNGVSRPLKVYMGRTRPVVADGQVRRRNHGGRDAPARRDHLPRRRPRSDRVGQEALVSERLPTGRTR